MLVFELSNVFGLWSQPFDQTIQNSRQVKASLDRFVYKHIFSLYIKQSSPAKFGFQMVGLVYRHVYCLCTRMDHSKMEPFEYLTSKCADFESSDFIPPLYLMQLPHSSSKRIYKNDFK